ncbi:AAA family ATPase [Aquibacillus albus]|uniref:Chromosome partitioning protein n=1 Tax=Aquibacillus albus TaxID=1168171 RepID=A0ABS2N3K6_9BACI|nr:chromosome partitioning protein [Aquibacillus albus]
MENRAKVISVINWKGGVGKTTLTHHIAAGLQNFSLDKMEELLNAKTYPKVLLIDADAQCNLSISCITDNTFEKFIGGENEEHTKGIKALFEEFLTNDSPDVNVQNYILKKAVRSNDNKVYKNIDLIPAHPDLIYTDMDIAVYSRPNFRSNLIGAEIYKFQILDNVINSLRNQYDFIFIDCPPNLNFITQNALYASDFYLIPTIPDKLSSYGILSIKHKIDDLNSTFQSASSEYTNTKLLGIVPNNIRESGNKPKDTQANILSTLNEIFPDDVFKNYLTYGDGISRASALGYPVFAYEGSHQNSTKQSKLIRNIIKELLGKMEGVTP